MTIDAIHTHLEKVRTYYDQQSQALSHASKAYRKTIAYYYRHLIPESASVLEVGCGQGTLLAFLPNQDKTGIDLSGKQIEQARKAHPGIAFHQMAGEKLSLDRKFDYIILSDTINDAADVQELLESLHRCSNEETRLILNFHNNLWKPFLTLLDKLGIRNQAQPENWFSSNDVRGLLRLSDWEIIKMESHILCPLNIPILSSLINRMIAPLFPILNLSIFTVARPRKTRHKKPEDYSVSVIVPARNEAGNLRDAIERIPEMGKWTELIFIEGNSTDNTWEVMQELPRAYPQKRIQIMQQTGKGKGNAVREGFAKAKGDILMILDADLTMPPEELSKYFKLLASGRAEFVNGVRLVYPMEDKAMRFLNMCANKLFSIIFSWLLAQPVKDTLCGTKVLLKKDYEKIAANRKYFGDFDPFGDFDLLFGATKQNLKIVDIPIRYRNRNYGDTNISRFRHGMILFKMVAYALFKLKFI